MVKELPKEWLQWLYNVLKPEYTDPQYTYRDVAITLQTLDLKVRTKIYTSDNGKQELLLCLYGPIETNFQNVFYKIPVEIWVPKNYPDSPPMVYVTSPPETRIQPGNYVDVAGRFYNPFFTSWRPRDPQYTLWTLCNLLSGCFSVEFPLVRQTEVVRPQPPLPEKPPSSEKQYFVGKPPLPEKPAIRPPSSGLDTVQQAISRLSMEASLQTTPPPLPSLPRRSSTNHQVQLQPPIDLMSSEEPSKTSDETEELKNHIESVLAETLQKEVSPQLSATNATVSQLNNTISQFEQILQYEKSTINGYLKDIEINENILKSKISEAEETIKKAETYLEPEVDDIVCAETVVYNQLYNLSAEIKAIDDTIYGLSKLHDRNKITTDSFVRHARALAREQFMHKALVDKILEVM